MKIILFTWNCYLEWKLSKMKKSYQTISYPQLFYIFPSISPSNVISQVSPTCACFTVNIKVCLYVSPSSLVDMMCVFGCVSLQPFKLAKLQISKFCMRTANNKKLPVARKKMQTKITHNKMQSKEQKARHKQKCRP